jgi:hypothetical protein
MVYRVDISVHWFLVMVVWNKPEFRRLDAEVLGKH